MMDAVTTTRLATLASSGFETETELTDAILYFVQSLGTNLLGEGHVSDEQKRGIDTALNDVPATIGVFRNVIASVPCSQEEKSNLEFMLGKLMDDMISLGAVATMDGSDKSSFSLLAVAKRGGQKSGEARRQKSENGWRAIAREKAKHFRDQQPALSTPALASEIIAVWPNDAAPSHSAVAALIREMEKSGELPTQAI